VNHKTKYPPGTALHPRIRLRGFNYSDPNALYFVTIRCSRHVCAFKDPAIAQHAVSELNRLRHDLGVSLYAYCVMPDHVHVLLRLATGNHALGTVISSFKSRLTSIWRDAGNRGQLWQRRFYDHVLRPEENPGNVVDYIIHNPIRRGIVNQAEDYPFTGMPDPM
jgi:putative transposase